MKILERLRPYSLAGLFTLACPALALAQTDADKIKALEAATKAARSAGDNAWMLTSAALVLMMTGPGLALTWFGVRAAF